jgi:hypothetical protein
VAEPRPGARRPIRFANCVADGDPLTCMFAEFSSKWRTAFLILVADPITVLWCANGPPHATEHELRLWTLLVVGAYISRAVSSGGRRLGGLHRWPEQIEQPLFPAVCDTSAAGVFGNVSADDCVDKGCAVDVGPHRPVCFARIDRRR